jgi:hypothetical protein
VSDGAPNFIGSAVAVGATAGRVGVRVAAERGAVVAFATACVGVAAATGVVSGRVGIGVTVGAGDVAVGGGGVAVMMTVMTWGGTVGKGEGVVAVPQPAMSVANSPRTSSRAISLFIKSSPQSDASPHLLIESF